MFAIEVVRPSVLDIKVHGPSLNKVLQCTQQAFNISFPELKCSSTAKLGQVLDLIATHYGFTSFGALKCYLEQSSDDLHPLSDSRDKLLNKIRTIFGLDSIHPLANHYLTTINSYISHSNLPEQINLSVESYFDNNLEVLRYMHIEDWDERLLKLIKNPTVKVNGQDQYHISEIERLVRVNLLNTLLPHAEKGMNEGSTSCTLKLSNFFGGQISKKQFKMDMACFFNGKVIGSGLLDVSGVEEIDRNQQLFNYHQIIGRKTGDIYAFEDSDLVNSMNIEFRIRPRLQSLLKVFAPTPKPCPQIKINSTIFSELRSTAIAYSASVETHEKYSAKTILEDMINNLQALNNYIDQPFASWYQAEPKYSESNLAFRQYTLEYANSLVMAMIDQANKIVLGQRLTKKRIYFDENGMLILNFKKPVEFVDSNQILRSMSQYNFSIYMNMIIFGLIKKHHYAVDAGEVAFRLMMNYMEYFAQHININEKQLGI